MHDKRLTTRLITYWEQLQGDQAIPAFHTFNPGYFDVLLWNQCVVFKVLPSTNDKKSYYFDFLGERIIEAYGKDLTGQIYQAAHSMVPGGKVLNYIDKVMLDPKPTIEDGQFINEKNQVVKFRSCLLPFGSDRDNITHIIAGLSWRAF